MRKYMATNSDYEQFKEDLKNNREGEEWFSSEYAFYKNFKVEADRETALTQVVELNKKYSVRLSRGLSKQPDECGELADFIASNSFKARIMTTDKDIAAALVIDLAKAAKTRGRYLLSFASKYCHHCNPTMYPIFDSINEKYIKDHYSYICKRDYRKYMEAYFLFCNDIGVKDLCNAKDTDEGFFVDKFINNIEK